MASRNKFDAKDGSNVEYLRISNDEFRRGDQNSLPWGLNPRLMIYGIVFSAIILVMVFVRLYLLFQPTTERIVLFGDSLVRRNDNYIGRNVQKNLKGSFGGVKVYSSGVSGNCIADMKGRMNDDVLERKAFGLLTFWTLGPPDAVILYWDSDAVDVDDSLDPTVLQTYQDDLRYVLQQLQDRGVNYIAVGGPTLDGELPHGENEKDSILDLYTDINRNITTEFGFPYFETRQLFFDNIPSTWSYSSGYLTDDGEHQNQRGADLLVNLFENALNGWLSTIPSL